MNKFIGVLHLVMIFSCPVIGLETQESENPKTILCQDELQQDTLLSVFYDSSNDNIQLVNYKKYFAHSFLLNSKARETILLAIEKSEEWKDVAIRNHIVNLIKDIPGVEETHIKVIRNEGNRWISYPVLIKYQFLISTDTESTRYYFLIKQISLNDLTHGVIGSYFLFPIGRATDELRMVLTEEWIAIQQEQTKRYEIISELFK